MAVHVQQLRLFDNPREYDVRCLSSVSDRPLDPTAVLDELGDTPDAGAVVLFSGVVRNHDAGRAVHRLEYEGHPTADQVLEEVVCEVLGRHPEVRAAAAHHRVGPLAIGDTAMVVVTCAAHRQAAFAATADVVEEVKARLPVWKRQVFTDGTEEWVNSA
ncbi:MAG: molybdenum cofactor biosynthesis protein MoaE [Nocardioides sp.]|nr:molybdenum cofactor biosynthesis protein MoaE [Nocardioides sp.]